MSATLVAALSGAALGAGVADLLADRAERRARALRRQRAADDARGGASLGWSGGSRGWSAASLSWSGGSRRCSGASRGPVGASPGNAGPLTPLLRLSRAVGAGVGRRLPVPTDAALRLDAAGLSPAVTVADLGALRGAGVVVGLATTLVALPVVGGAALWLGFVLPLALVLLPELAVGRRTRRRAASMLVDLPDAIDLLRIALRSGRSVPEALARVGAHHHGDLGRELRRTAAEQRMGVATDRALVQLRRRCPAEGAAELVALLLRVHGQGGAATEGLQALAEDLRARRARRAIDRASRAAPKVQLVVALLLVPAAMLLIAAVLLQLRDAG